MRFTKNNTYGTTQLPPHTIILDTSSQKTRDHNNNDAT